MKNLKNNPLVCGLIGALIGSCATYAGLSFIHGSSDSPNLTQTHAEVKPDNFKLVPYDENGDVYITRYGKKFHRKTCGSLRRSREILRVSSSDAEEKGLSACSKCF